MRQKEIKETDKLNAINIINKQSSHMKAPCPHSNKSHVLMFSLQMVTATRKLKDIFSLDEKL